MSSGYDIFPNAVSVGQHSTPSAADAPTRDIRQSSSLHRVSGDERRLGGYVLTQTDSDAEHVTRLNTCIQNNDVIDDEVVPEAEPRR